MSTKRERWIAAWKTLSDHTKDWCGAGNCRGAEYRPNRCCDSMYCDIATDVARNFGEQLEPTGHPDLPYMGEDGCTVPPHLRPMCTAHVCIISNIGFDIKDPDWTELYFELRDRASTLSYEMDEE